MIKKNSFLLNQSLLFLLPSLLGFMLFFVVPFFLSFTYVFQDKSVNGRFIGFDNFTELFTNPAYLVGLKNTFIFISLCVPITIILSLAASLQIKTIKKHHDLFILIFLIPLVIPSGSVVLFWKSFFEYNGALNGFLYSFGIARIHWLDSSLTMFVAVFIYTWKFVGYNMILFLSGLSSIPIQYYEAAYVDGANELQLFFKITLPNLAPTFVIAVLMSMINSFKIFKEIYLITGNYPHESVYMLQHFMNNMFSSLNYPKLATATSILVLVISLITIFLKRIERRVS